MSRLRHIWALEGRNIGMGIEHLVKLVYRKTLAHNHFGYMIL